jgi:hypothetical protein
VEAAQHETFSLANGQGMLKRQTFFEKRGRPGKATRLPGNPLQDIQASGNLVKIEDGCATVTGYKLPRPLVGQPAGKAGARSNARSQDIGLVVLVMIPLRGIDFSVKRRMRPAFRVGAWKIRRMPSFSVCRGLEALFSLEPALVSQSLTKD